MITDNYIKMCSKAEEIQKEWKPQAGDWQYWSNDKTKMANIFMITSLQKKYKANIRIWLPTQEQLQEIMFNIKDIGGHDYSDLGLLFSLFTDFIYRTAYKNIHEFWLAFVMYEKYQKSWDGENWVKN